MILLENDFLKVNINPVGAEIHSIIGKKDEINYMWKQDPSQWAHSAPILFPIVGALRNGECKIDNITYKMNQHGFSRNSTYTALHMKKDSVELELKSNDEIKQMYPYIFDLNVHYYLVENMLHCDLYVKNIDKNDIYFQIGGHPAFSCPFQEGEDVNSYYLEFENKETCSQKIIDIAKAGMSHTEVPFFDNENRFFVRQALFNNDAIVLKDLKSKCVTLKSLDNDKSLKFHFNNFKYLGIWTAKHVGGLLAIEPWVGHSDYTDFEGDFKDKEGIVNLKPNEVFKCDFAIEINQ
ncbi:MAG: aldose 1-epimerase family protein [Thomasclavelia sp.]|nr:aldose 1-epimerase family protein [Thomasclavelia sp.]